MADESPTLDLLERLSAAPRLTFDALQRQSGLPEGVLRGRLRHLVERGWVDASADGRSYAIGVGALRPGSAYLSGDRAARLAGPVLARLREQLDEAFRLVRLDGPAIVGLAGASVGQRLPALCSASGRAILAARPRADAEALLDRAAPPAHTVATAADRASLLAALDETRARGWAYERGEVFPGIGCIAAHVPSPDLVTDAISCAVPLPRLTDDHAVDLAASVRRAALELAALIG